MPISPSFQFFPSDFLGDPNTLAMTAEEVGAYWLLACVCWDKDGLPNDLEELADYARMDDEAFQKSWARRVSRCFVLDEKRNVWTHKRFEKIKKEIRAFRKQKSEAGKVSGRKRRERKGLTPEQVFVSVQVPFEQKGNENEPSYPFSYSSSIPNILNHGNDKSPIPINSSSEEKLIGWLDAVAVAVGAGTRAGLADRRWEQACIKAIDSGLDREFFTRIVQREYATNARYTNPDKCVQIAQSERKETTAPVTPKFDLDLSGLYQ